MQVYNDGMILRWVYGHYYIIDSLMVIAISAGEDLRK